MDITKLLNEMLAQFLPQLNQELPQAITDANLDPLANVASEKKTFAKINLGICHARATGDYAIEDMKGLSSLSITAMTVKNANTSNLTDISGTISLSVKLSRKLSAKLGGGLTAKCGITHLHVGISGTASATGLSGTAMGNFNATFTLSSGRMCLTNFSLQNLSLNYTDINVKVNHLGVFNKLLNLLVDAINKLFGKAIKGEISAKLTPVLAKQISKRLPFCTKL